jgi:hypothetical protein
MIANIVKKFISAITIYVLCFVLGVAVTPMLPFYTYKGTTNNTENIEYSKIFNRALDAYLLGDNITAMNELENLNRHNSDIETRKRAVLIRNRINEQKESVDTTISPKTEDTEQSQTTSSSEVITEHPTEGNPLSPMDIITFGDMDWYVLAEEKGEMLLLSKDIIGRSAYQTEPGTLTWEHSSIREYLNSEFLSMFSPSEQNLILEKSIRPRSTFLNSSDGSYVVVQGGNPTKDKVFLLSIEEIIKYFSADDFENERNAWCAERYGNVEYTKKPYSLSQVSINGAQVEYEGEFTWWWLRSPAYYEEGTAVINLDGDLDVGGYISINQEGGIRPAMWIASE